MSARDFAILEPIEVTDAVLLSSSAAEDSTPEWSSGTTYAINVDVHRPGTHRVYRSLANSNTNNTPESSPAFWFDMRPTNRWAMFDAQVQSATEAADQITVSLAPGGITGVMLAQLVNAAWVRVRQRSSVGGAVVYEQTRDLAAVGIVDWETWVTAPFKWRRAAAFLDLLPYFDGEIEVTIQGNGLGNVKVGVLAVGGALKIGQTQRGLTYEGRNYTRVTEDDYGTTAIRQGARAQDLEFELIVPTDDLDTVVNALEDAKETPSGFIPNPGERYSPLMTFGLVERYRATLFEVDYFRVTGKVKGLT